ncbi:low temperature requirement protein A, partial [Streptomyces sp. 7R007]
MTSSPTPRPAHSGANTSGRPLRRLTARGRDEAHRVASPLELFFDLCFVVAIAQAGVQLVHAVTHGHAGEGILNYAMVFFAIWWAWMNFTWFASAYDNDDVLYRVVTLVQVAGVLVLAAGVSRAFDDHEFLAVWLGYLIMRLAMVSQWIRAALSSEGAEKTVALRYAGGVLVCQVGWLGLLFLPEGARPWVFLVMAVLEMCVPPFAERGHPTSWHPHHISERYGLFTIIVLGETIAAATVAVKSGIDENDALTDLLPIAAGGLLIIFAAWWIYFVVPIHGHLRTNRQAFLWGYGHYLIFASAAAIGAGLEVAVEQAIGKAHISTLSASAAVTLPTALYLLTVWALH